MVVVLKIANSPGMDAVESCTDSVRLMDDRHLPSGERQWTCRVWVKEILKALHRTGYIRLPADVDTIEQYCQLVADSNIHRMGNAKVFNDLRWLEEPAESASRVATVPMDIDATGSRGSSYYGSSPMVIDSSGSRYYGYKPMIIDSTRGRYYG